MRRRAGLLVGVACLLALAGCALPPAGGDRGPPDGDPLGWEAGHWSDDSLSIETADGLNASEREAVVARTMARIERLRQLEFESTVDISLVSRAQYRANRTGSDNITASNRWNDQVWEALYLVGEDAHFTNVMDSTLGTSVLGYYDAGKDAIVIVSDSETPTLSRSTLVHELVHALQDQQFGLNASQTTQDTQLAVDGLYEGEATLLQRRYEQRCGSEWSCADLSASGTGASGASATDQSPYRRGVFTVIYQPYASGPGFVRAIEARGGWSAVDDVHESLPASTEQVIHPGAYPDERPVTVTVPDRSGPDWTRFDHDPVGDTVGEASIYAMFATNGETEGSLYSYESPPSAGWAGDSLVPYRSGDRYGYVWRTAWDSPADAREFLAAYRSLLEGRDATRRGDGVYEIPADDPFGDAIRIRRSGDRVTVVNAPTVEALGAVHAAG